MSEYRTELVQVAAVAHAMLCDQEAGTSGFDGFAWPEAVQEIMEERDRQEVRWGPQHHSPWDWFAILGEEVGEAVFAAMGEFGLVREDDPYAGRLASIALRLVAIGEDCRALLEEKFSQENSEVPR